MLFDRIANFTVNFYHEYPIAVWVLAVVALVVAWRKPKESFKFAVFLVIMFCVIYAVGLFGETVSTGSRNKQDAVQKSRDLAD